MKTYISLFLLIFCFLSFAEEKKEETKSAFQFFRTEAQKAEKTWYFSPYEGIISGALAFTFGNVAYFTEKDSVLKLAYSGVQTIGIINVATGVYDLKKPVLEGEFSHLLDKAAATKMTKEQLASGMVKIFADEERAKRLSIFYGSSLLVLQYALNASLGNPPKSLKNTYMFLGGVNGIIAIYSLSSKGKYEKFYYGDDWDISLGASELKNNYFPTLQLSFRF